MAAVVIGVDPAKRSNTIEVIDSEETVLLLARFENTSADYRRTRALVKRSAAVDCPRRPSGGSCYTPRSSYLRGDRWPPLS
jgi:hypothetical protein